MATKLYFHAASSTVTGTLPSTEQSTLTPDAISADATSVNRSMSINVGTSQTSIQITSAANTAAHNYYFTKFVSDPLNQSGVAANTWNYNFAANESTTAANFPVTTSGPVYVNCYVWRPSNGTLVGTILDGNSATGYAEPTIVSERVMNGTFTGAAVASAAAGDVIVFEVWFQITQGTGSATTDIFYFDGTIENATANTLVTTHASYISTPENLIFTRSGTKLYLHAALTPVTGTLPINQSGGSSPTVQGGISPFVYNADATSVNRTMDLNKGTAETTIAQTSLASVAAQSYYFTKFISPPLASTQTSITANTWSFIYAIAESNLSANFLGFSAYIYVWRPSTGALVAWIAQGSTIGGNLEPSVVTTEKLENTTIAGSAIASGIQQGDVIISELWARVTQASAAAYTDTFYYDGTTEQGGQATNTTVSDVACYLYSPETISFATAVLTTRTISESMTISESILRRPIRKISESMTVTESLKRKITRPTSESVTVSESIKRKILRAIAQSVSISETIVRTRRARFFISESITFSETIKRKITRAIAESITSSETIKRGITRKITETIAISESILRRPIRKISESMTITETSIKRKITRKTSEAITISESISAHRLFLRAISESIAITDSIRRKITRAIPQSITTTESIIRKIKRPNIAEGIAITESILRRPIRRISESMTITETSIKRKITRSVAQTITISESIVRRITRKVAEAITISESVSAHRVYIKVILESMAISESIKRKITRKASENVTISESILRKITRKIAQGITITEAVSAHRIYIRAIAESIAISESIKRKIIRIAAENISISENVKRRITRRLSESITITESILKQLIKRILISETITISESTRRRITRKVSDSVSVSESIRRKIARTVLQTMTIAESIQATFHAAGTIGVLKVINVFETIHITESIITRLLHKFGIGGAAGFGRITRYSRMHSPFLRKRNPFTNKMLNPYKRRKV